jgi:hypothetical protein
MLNTAIQQTALFLYGASLPAAVFLCGVAVMESVIFVIRRHDRAGSSRPPHPQ